MSSLMSAQVITVVFDLGLGGFTHICIFVILFIGAQINLQGLPYPRGLLLSNFGPLTAFCS